MLIGFDRIIYGTEAGNDIELSRTCFVNTMVSETGLNPARIWVDKFTDSLLYFNECLQTLH